VPSSPRDVQVSNATNTSLYVSWRRPQPLNGVILQYRVFYWRTDVSNRSSVVQMSFVPAARRALNITSLRPATSYSIQVGQLALVGLLFSTFHINLRVQSCAIKQTTLYCSLFYLSVVQVRYCTVRSGVNLYRVLAYSLQQ